MKKKDFELQVQNNLSEVGLDFNQKETTLIADTVFKVVYDLLVQGEEVPIGVLGKMTTVERGERKARNLQDGSEIIVPKHLAPKYKPSKLVKDTLKNK